MKDNFYRHRQLLTINSCQRPLERTAVSIAVRRGEQMAEEKGLELLEK
jgi:hypothetical protein